MRVDNDIKLIEVGKDLLFDKKYSRIAFCLTLFMILYSFTITS